MYIKLYWKFSSYNLTALMLTGAHWAAQLWPRWCFGPSWCCSSPWWEMESQSEVQAWCC